MKRAANIITKLMVGLLVSIALLTISAMAYARWQGRLLLSVQTGSMRPAIAPGDAVTVRIIRGRLKAGDIISYHSLKDPRRIITHRVIRTDDSRGLIVTKGDALATEDPPFGYSQVVGKVEQVVPAIGYSLDFVRRPAGLITMVYLPAIILVNGELRRLGKYYASRHYHLWAHA